MTMASSPDVLTSSTFDVEPALNLVPTPLPAGSLLNNNDTPPTDDSPTTKPKITIQDLMLDEIRMAVRVTQEYDEIIKTAKTQTKKNFYHKKMVTNNEFIMKALVMLEQYKKVSDAADKQKADEDSLELVKQLAAENITEK